MLVLGSGNHTLLSPHSRVILGLGPEPDALQPCRALCVPARGAWPELPSPHPVHPEAPEPSFLLSPHCHPTSESGRVLPSSALGGSRWGASRSHLSFTKPGGTPTSLNLRGPRGWAENQSPIWEARAQGEGIHLRVSETTWQRPREGAESSLHLGLTKGREQLSDGQPGCPSPGECTGQSPGAGGLTTDTVCPP